MCITLSKPLCRRRTGRGIVGQVRRRRGGTIVIEGLDYVDGDDAEERGDGVYGERSEEESLESWGTGEGDVNPRARKQRRTNRVAGQGLLRTPEGRNGRPVAAIGANHQADIPKHLTLSKEEWERKANVRSKLVFDPSKVNKGTVDKYVSAINERLLKRDGFCMAPYTMEIALNQLKVHDGVISKAVATSLGMIPKGPYFPGLTKPITSEEHSLFVTSLHERGKDFAFISKHILTSRKRSELVWMYYARHKQLQLEMGCLRWSIVTDKGDNEKMRSLALEANRAVDMLCQLARTGDDGFAVDGRLSKMIWSYRVKSIWTHVRKRRGAEVTVLNGAEGDGLTAGNVGDGGVGGTIGNGNTRRTRTRGQAGVGIMKE